MIKIREPLQTRLKPDVMNSQSAFTERIQGNYMQIGQYISGVDLLHVVTQPPEIFVVGGGTSNLMNSTNVEATQIQKVNIINNLINRIMMSADASLSYQDTVYITNILHKLGIRDERKFMKEVYRLTEETKVRNETVDLYWNHMDEIRTMVQEYTEQTNLELREEMNQVQQNVLYLHEEVNRRLNTAAIYRVMQNFYEGVEGPHNITNEEYRISEQRRVGQELLLNRLRETIRGESMPMVYHHNNVYEGDEADITNVTLEQVNERITSAVLLNLIDNVYESTYNRLNHSVQNWISTEAAYYGAAENTLFRIEENTDYLQYLNEQTQKTGDVNTEYRTELQLINNLVNLYEGNDIQMSPFLENRFYETELTTLQQAGDNYFEDRNEYHTSSDMSLVQNEVRGDNKEITQQNRNETTEQIDRSQIHNLVQETVQNSTYRSGDTNIAQTDIHYTSADITLVQNETGGDVTEVTQQSQTEVTEQIDRSQIRNLVQETVQNVNYRTGDTNIEQMDVRHTSADITLVQNEAGGDVTEVTQQSQTEVTEQVDRSQIRNLVQETVQNVNYRPGDTNIEQMDVRHTLADITLVQNETGGDVTEVTQQSQTEVTEQVDRSQIRNLVQETVQNVNYRPGDTNIEQMDVRHTSADITLVQNETGGDVTKVTQQSQTEVMEQVDRSQIRNLVQETVQNANYRTGDTNINQTDVHHTQADITLVQNENDGDVTEVTEQSQTEVTEQVDRSQIRNLVQETVQNIAYRTGYTNVNQTDVHHTSADITLVQNETGGDVTEVTQQNQTEVTEQVDRSRIRNLVQETIQNATYRTGDTNINQADVHHTPVDITLVQNETGGDVTEVTQQNQTEVTEQVDRSQIRNLVQETVQNAAYHTGDTNISQTEVRHTSADITLVQNETGGDVTEVTQLNQTETTEQVDRSRVRNLVQETVQNEMYRLGDTNVRQGDVYHSPADITLVQNETGGDVTEVTQLNQMETTEQVDRSRIRNLVQETVQNETRRSGDTHIEQTDVRYSPTEMTYVTQEGNTEETQVTQKQGDEFTERVYQTYQQNIARNAQYMRNLKTILNANRQESPSGNPVERTMLESRLALEHPTEFLQRFQEAEKAADERADRIQIETERLLTQEQQWAHQLIREYMKLPEQFYKTEIISRDNVGLLLRDVQEAEHEERYGGTQPSDTGSKEAQMILEQGREKAASPFYPPSSNTTVASRYPDLSSGIIPVEETERYQNIVLQNLFPVYRGESLFRDEATDVQMLADEVKERIQENGQAKLTRDREESIEHIVESIQNTERSFDREYTTVFNRMTEQAGQNLLYRRDSEIVKSVTNRVIERWQERKASAVEPAMEVENQNISMVHRTMETSVDEEVLEEIRQQLEQMEQTNKTTIRQVENQIAESRTIVNNVNEHTLEYNTEEIERLVNQNMKRQIDEISDKVYGKLERQLRNEQRRRGL